MPFIGVQPASALLTSADIQDGQITTAKIANDAVDNTKLDLTSSYDFSAGLTLGDNLTFDVAGKGVHLGVTSATASNLLDDYEEGTWTPLSGGGSGSTAYYTKVGRLVQIEGDVTFSGNSGSTNFISGLPFAPVTQGGAICVWQNIQSGVIGLLTGSGGMFLYNGQTTNINLGTGKRIIFSVTYYTS